MNRSEYEDLDLDDIFDDGLDEMDFDEDDEDDDRPDWLDDEDYD